MSRAMSNYSNQFPPLRSAKRQTKEYQRKAWANLDRAAAVNRLMTQEEEAQRDAYKRAWSDSILISMLRDAFLDSSLSEA
jgi:hypothetical protein